MRRAFFQEIVHQAYESCRRVPAVQMVSSRSEMMGVAFAEVVTAVLLLVEGFVLVDAGINGLTGAGVLMLSGLIGGIWAILSFVAAFGLRRARKWSWNLSMALAIIAIVLNAGLIGLALSSTGTFIYPGLAVVLLIVVNDVILAELAVSYLLMKPEIKAHLGRTTN